MFLFLRPKYIKQGKLYIKEAEKRVHYNRDIWEPAVVSEFEAGIRRLKEALKARDPEAAANAEKTLDTLLSTHCAAGPGAWFGENVEVFLVAIIVALGIRTYILQPFTIPTASMQPTLFGITGRPTEQEPPNILRRVFDFAWYGRTWHNAVAEEDGEVIESIEEVRRSGWRRFMTYTRITTKGKTGTHEYWVNEGKDPLRKDFGVELGAKYSKGQPIVRGFTDTGDHVFVDKMSYNFRKPRRGEVFVFDTRTLNTVERRNPVGTRNTQYYIKRLAGLPGDELRISPPELFVNGKVAEAEGFKRVMQGTRLHPVDGYHGYGNFNFANYGYVRPLLTDPGDTFTVPEKHYMALGDNSYASSDSRDWGPVPYRNLMGTGVFVYWPFSRALGGRWGFIQ